MLSKRTEREQLESCFGSVRQKGTHVYYPAYNGASSPALASSEPVQLDALGQLVRERFNEDSQDY